MKRIVIIGGGIAGLAAAYRLTRLTPQPRIILLESAPRLGGKIVTERSDGFIIEGGPDSFLGFKPRGVGLCRELGLEARLHGPNDKVRGSYIMRGGKLYELPEGLTGLIPTRLGPLLKTGLLSPLGKLRMGLDYLIPPRSANGDESLETFVERRLGREAYDRLIEPLMTGIYAGEGAQLSLAATFPQLRQIEREHGGLIKGVLAAQKKATRSKTPMGFLTLTGGLGELVETLEAKLAQVEIRRGAAVAAVTATATGYNVMLASGETLAAEAVILATPAFATAKLVADLNPELGNALQNIPHISTATISMAYAAADVPQLFNGYGYIIPRAEGRRVLACTWASTKFPGRAPEGYTLIRAFVGRAGQAEILGYTEAELLALAREELQRTVGVTAAPVMQRIFRWPNALPQYTLGHLDRLATIDRCLAAHPGLFVAGNAYRGVGIPDCIASGEAAAEKAIK